MNHFWRQLTKRCKCCGQKLNSNHNTTKRLADINRRATCLTAQLGHRPRVQNCIQCRRLIFEGEPGFRKRYLILDFELIHAHPAPNAVHELAPKPLA